MDPISEAILQILGEETTGRLLRQTRQAVPGSEDEPIRQGTTRLQVELLPPYCDLKEYLLEEQLIDRLLEDDNGCHS